MKKIRLAIIFGGNSSEYSVSLHSTASVLQNLNKELYFPILIGITQTGTWYEYRGDIETLEHDHWQQDARTRKVILSTSSKQGFMVEADGHYVPLDVDCVFPILHGKHGEDGTLQGLLELANIPYVGCNHTTSALAMDKEFTHIICEAKGIEMAPYIVAHKAFYRKEDVLKVVKKLHLPLFVKPANAGSSFGISKVIDFDCLDEAITFAFEHDQKILIEEGIDGFEIGCSVLGNYELIIGELDEIETHNGFFDYEAKYALENTKIHCPARLDETTREKAKAMGESIYKMLGCRGLSRIDMFVGADQKLYFNEINTIPGFTSASRYPMMMKQAGISFADLIDRLITLALEVQE
ncbi:MAG: D-alanine--D-alanine ligase family protein [Breznakia sp.]